ncbi:MAG: extracellular solute-binding protein [Oscillospiraceae bacterium]|nr:extracellular solute-binding protein [Oscillospiraceae bacterium]
MNKLVYLCIAAALFMFTACQGDVGGDYSENTDGVISEQVPVLTNENGDILIRIATDETEYLPIELRTAMDSFNEMDNGYHVEPVIYAQAVMGKDESGGLQTADMRLLMDVMQGENVDVVMDYSFFDLSNYDILSEKGAFVDLYTFLDGDSGISRSELNTRVLEIHENDGKLYQMPLYFGIETMCGKGDYVGTKENWTLDELITHWEQMPEGTFFCNNTNQWLVYMSLIRSNLGAFVDYKNGSCSFDSPEFVALLEFCNRFPETKEKLQPDWDTVYFLHSYSFNGFDKFQRCTDEDTVFVGYPSENGLGSFVDTLRKRYSICASAPPAVQEGAWEFISYMLNEEVQANNNAIHDGSDVEEHGFPINNAAFQRMAEEQLSHQGESRLVTAGEKEYDLGYLTQAEYDQLLILIGSLNRMNSPIDKAAHNIIENEVKALFAGERTAEEVAKAIQGRMEIMISERM